MIREPIAGPRAWTRRTIDEGDWRIALPPRCLDEIEQLARALERDPVPTYLLDPSDYELDACRDLLGEVRRRLEEGPGIAVVDRIPIEELARPRGVRRPGASEALASPDLQRRLPAGRGPIEAVFWLLAGMVGRPVVQTLDGQILVEVTDTGVKKQVGVRGFRTQRRATAARRQLLQPHAAGPRQPALPPRGPRGRGEPLRELLLGPQRPSRGAPGAARTPLPPLLPGSAGRLLARRSADRLLFPVFELRPDLRCRYTHFTIPAGYETAGVEMDTETRAAFEAMTRAVQDPDLCCEFTLRPGELQFVNNRWCGHGRTAYVDDPERRRLMLRLWHRDGGSRRYRG